MLCATYRTQGFIWFCELTICSCHACFSIDLVIWASSGISQDLPKNLLSLFCGSQQRINMFKLLAARSWPVTTKSDESDVLLTSTEQDTVEGFSEPLNDSLATSEECRLPRKSRLDLKGRNWQRLRYVLILSTTSIFLLGVVFFSSMHCQAITYFNASDICPCSCYVTIKSYCSDLFYASMRSRCCRALAECVFTVTENRSVYQFPRLRLWGLGF